MIIVIDFLIQLVLLISLIQLIDSFYLLS